MTDTVEEQVQTQEEQDAEAGFAAGAAKVLKTEEPQPEAGEPAAAEDPKEKEAEAQAQADAKAKQEQEAADKAAYDALPQAAKDRLAKIDSLATTMDRLAGHIGGLTTATQRIEAGIKAARSAAVKSGADTPSDAQIEAASGDPAKLKQLVEDYPDLAGPIVEALNDLGKRVGKAPAVDLEAIEQRAVKAATAQMSGQVSQLNKRFLTFMHSDWEKLDDDPAFNAWIEKNPDQKDRIVAAKGDPFEVGGVLTKFKEHRATEAEAAKAADAKRQGNQRRLQAATTPQGTTSTPTTGISDEDAFERGVKRALRR